MQPAGGGRYQRLASLHRPSIEMSYLSVGVYPSLGRAASII
jgi:hypothetical protein